MIYPDTFNRNTLDLHSHSDTPLVCTTIYALRNHSTERTDTWVHYAVAGGIGGAAAFFHPDRKPAIAAMVPNNPTQPSEIKPFAQDQ